MPDSEPCYPREFSTRTVDPAWLLAKVRRVQTALLTYERWAEDHGWSAPVTARELIGHVFNAAFALDGWLDILRVGEAKAAAKETGLCSILAILREACSGITAESGKVRWAADELRVIGFKPRTKPIRFSAAAPDQLTLAAESLDAWRPQEAGAGVELAKAGGRRGAPLRYPQALARAVELLGDKSLNDQGRYNTVTKEFGSKEELPKRESLMRRARAARSKQRIE